jgi:hypothetical protein
LQSEAKQNTLKLDDWFDMIISDTLPVI